jgi:hypothetical protein
MSNKRSQADLYNVETYTDQELYDILDINSPTDRELEAKIIFLIKKYKNMQNTSGNELAKFFTDIYNHFFEDSEDNEEDLIDISNEIQEGLTNMDIQRVNDGTITMEDFKKLLPQQSNDKIRADLNNFNRNNGNVVLNNDSNGNINTNTNITFTKPLDYAGDSLNPLLNQTIKRIISIDSQYREDKTTMTTEFSFNLSTPLKDVVSLKLYSFQIPVTWYTISNAYGSNFFYLKGNSPGLINNSTQDMIFDISAGNYDAQGLVDTINSTIQKKKAIYSDVDFGTTALTYNKYTGLCRTNVNVTKTYNENSYYLQFSNFTTPNYISDLDRVFSIPSFLGFNNQTYFFNTLNSTYTFPYYTESSNIDGLKLYTIDNTNNYIKIIKYTASYNIYTGLLESYLDLSNNNNLNIDTSFNITLSLTPTSIFGKKYSRTDIFYDLSKQIHNTKLLLRNESYINRFNIIDASNANYGNSYFQLKIKPNRFTTKNFVNSKIAIIFPYESNAINNIWTGPNSCFNFSNTFNDLNNIVGESPAVAQTITYPITSNPRITINCINPEFISPLNNITIPIQNSPTNSPYTIEQYLGAINNGIVNATALTPFLNGPPNNSYSYIYSPFSNPSYSYSYVDDNTFFKLFLNIEKVFDNTMYSLDLKDTFLYDNLNLGNNENQTIPVTQNDTQYIKAYIEANTLYLGPNSSLPLVDETAINSLLITSNDVFVNNSRSSFNSIKLIDTFGDGVWSLLGNTWTITETKYTITGNTFSVNANNINLSSNTIFTSANTFSTPLSYINIVGNNIIVPYSNFLIDGNNLLVSGNNITVNGNSWIINGNIWSDNGNTWTIKGNMFTNSNNYFSINDDVNLFSITANLSIKPINSIGLSGNSIVLSGSTYTVSSNYINIFGNNWQVTGNNYSFSNEEYNIVGNNFVCSTNSFVIDVSSVNFFNKEISVNGNNIIINSKDNININSDYFTINSNVISLSNNSYNILANNISISGNILNLNGNIVNYINANIALSGNNYNLTGNALSGNTISLLINNYSINGNSIIISDSSFVLYEVNDFTNNKLGAFGDSYAVNNGSTMNIVGEIKGNNYVINSNNFNISGNNWTITGNSITYSNAQTVNMNYLGSNWIIYGTNIVLNGNLFTLTDVGSISQGQFAITRSKYSINNDFNKGYTTITGNNILTQVYGLTGILLNINGDDYLFTSGLISSITGANLELVGKDNNFYNNTDILLTGNAIIVNNGNTISFIGNSFNNFSIAGNSFSTLGNTFTISGSTNIDYTITGANMAITGNNILVNGNIFLLSGNSKSLNLINTNNYTNYSSYGININGNIYNIQGNTISFPGNTITVTDTKNFIIGGNILYLNGNSLSCTGYTTTVVNGELNIFANSIVNSNITLSNGYLNSSSVSLNGNIITLSGDIWNATGNSLLVSNGNWVLSNGTNLSINDKYFSLPESSISLNRNILSIPGNILYTRENIINTYSNNFTTNDNTISFNKNIVNINTTISTSYFYSRSYTPPGNTISFNGNIYTYNSNLFTIVGNIIQTDSNIEVIGNNLSINNFVTKRGSPYYSVTADNISIPGTTFKTTGNTFTFTGTTYSFTKNVINIGTSSNLISFGIDVLYNNNYLPTTKLISNFTIPSLTIDSGDVILKLNPRYTPVNAKFGNENQQTLIIRNTGNRIFCKTITELQNNLNKIITSFIDPNSNTPIFSGTPILLNINTTNLASVTIDCSFNLIINKVLTYNDYSINFNDSTNNSWGTNFFVDSIMTNNDYPLNSSVNSLIPDVYGQDITIVAVNQVKTININLIKGVNDYLTIVANENGVTSPGNENNVTITIPIYDKNNNVILYSRESLLQTINNLLSSTIAAGTYLSTIVINGSAYVQIKSNINLQYTSNDYNLVFYDTNSFVKCYVGVTSVRNTTWDSTLGWILGYRTLTTYILSNYENKIISGDTGVCTNLFNYFLLCLDDYNQNYLNDGLVTITSNETNIPLPSYANKTQFICDAATGRVLYNSSESNNYSNLTQNQLYTITEIANNKNNKITNLTNGISPNSYGAGPFVQDIFAILPLKITGIPNGSVYVENGGTLQNQDRLYFGPVNIQRMSVKLVTDRGDVVDLNGANWSFSLVCEQIYKKKPSK